MHNSISFISRRYVLFVIMLLIIGGVTVYGQERNGSVKKGKGVVLDSYGNPVSNVEVQIEGAQDKVISDENGEFAFNGKVGDVMIFLHPGFYTKYHKIKAKDLLDSVPEIDLAEQFLKDPSKMDVLYGEADKNEYLGAASTIYTDQLTSVMSNSIIDAMSGRLASLYVQQYNGFRNTSTSANSTVELVGSVPVFGASLPSDNSQFNLNIRGNGLVTVVDGIQRDLYSLDPENIESVSVQRDALSSILLGMRSSRGILLITTKKPSDSGFQLSFTGRYGVQSSVNIPDVLSADKYAYLLNEALTNDGKDVAYSDEDYRNYRDGTNSFLYPDINWYDAVLKDNAPTSSYNLNISGGVKTARYFISLGYYDQEGLFKSSKQNSYDTNLEFERYLINSKLEVDITNDLNVGVTIIGRVEEGNQPGSGTYNILSNIYSTPNGAYPIYNPDGSFGGNVSFTNNIMAQTISSGYISDKTRDAIANIDINYDLGKLLNGLKFKALTNISSQNVGVIDRSKSELVYEYKPGEEEGAEATYSSFGTLSSQSNDFVSVSNLRQWYGLLSLEYENSFGKHNIKGKLHADKQVITVNYDLPLKPANLAATAKYNFNKKYFAEAAVNRSYFNRYKPRKQYGLFYALGLGWNIKKEKFFSNVNWLDKLKLRGVYGKTGNGIENSGYYLWRQAYEESVLDYSYPQGTSKGIGTATYESSPLANMNITWEKAHKLNLGIDVSMFKRLQFSGDYYYDRYYDLLQIRGKSIALMGFDYPPENIGKKLFKGTELSLTYQNNAGNFNYYVTANWGQSKSEVLFIDEQYKQEEYNRITGKPNGAWFGLVADGFFNSADEIDKSPVIEGVDIIPGDVKYLDLNNDGVIDQYDQTVIGNDKPLSYYGVTLGFNIHGIDFNILFQGVYNKDIYLGDNVLMQGFQSYGQSYGQAYTNIINRWTPETKETAILPRLSAGGNSYNMSPNGWYTSMWVRSGNYLRVKNIYLGYTLPFKFTKQYMGGARIKLFVNGQNLFTSAGTDIVDPELTSFSSYPLQKVISTGINIKF